MDQFMELLQKLFNAMAEARNLLVFALIAVGYICKKVTFIPNKIIPLIVLVTGVAFGPFVVKPVYAGILHGIVFAGLASLIYEAIIKHAEEWITAKFSTPSCADKDKEVKNIEPQVKI